MGRKEIEVACPCCSTRLVVDVLTATVLKQIDPRQVDETGKAVLDEGRWDKAEETVRDRPAGSKNVFDAALDKEKARPTDLDDLFDKARDKIAERKRKLEEDS
jgi:hypothetical protein